MYFGLNTNNERICIYNANKQEEYFCPICHGKLRIRAGKINAMHFSHINLQECDDFTTDMSEWHR